MERSGLICINLKEPFTLGKGECWNISGWAFGFASMPIMIDMVDVTDTAGQTVGLGIELSDVSNQ